VADPWLFHTDVRDRVQRDRAVRTAVAWGADIISMSFGGPCNYACRQFERDNDTNRGYSEAVDRGIILVASAGNTTNDVGAENFVHPCILDGVICVGALANNVNTAASFSNYGAGVDIWAPTNVNALTGGTTAPIFTTFGGTSASAPFVAGIAAMARAINPTLTSDQMRGLLRDTAWTDSPDGKVSHYVNAYEAVRRASNGVLPRDRFEPNDSPAAAKAIAVGQQDDLTLHDASDRDYYRLTVASPGNVVLTSTHADAIGKPYVNFSKTDNCGGATQLTKISQLNQQTWTYGVTPGEYLIQVSSGRALPYDLGIASSVSILSRDSFEGIPDNDTFARAFSVGKGGSGYRDATIFPGGDVDFYRVESTGTIFNPKVGGKKFIFAIVAADMPLAVDLFDDQQKLIQTLNTSTDCKSLPSLTLPAGTFFIRVRATSTGGYTFAVGERHESGIIYDMRALWRLLIDPAGPIEFFVRGPEERFVFERGLERVTAIHVIGPGLHATLLDSAGNLVAEGRSDTLEGQTRERIPLDRTIPGESYVIKLEREIGVVPGQGMHLPRLNGRFVLVPG
jgi:hypothetical protein